MPYRTIKTLIHADAAYSAGLIDSARSHYDSESGEQGLAALKAVDKTAPVR